MRHVKLSLQVELDGDILDAVLRLPPGAVLGGAGGLGGLHTVDDVLYPVRGPEGRGAIQLLKSHTSYSDTLQSSDTGFTLRCIVRVTETIINHIMVLSLLQL